MNAITLIVYIALAFGIMVGVVKPKRFRRLVVGLAVGPILIGIALTFGRQLFESLSTLQKIAVIIIGAIPVSLALLRIVLPRDVWAGVVSGLIYDVLKWIFLFPMRVGRSMFHLISRRAIRYVRPDN